MIPELSGFARYPWPISPLSVPPPAPQHEQQRQQGVCTSLMTRLPAAAREVNEWGVRARVPHVPVRPDEHKAGLCTELGNFELELNADVALEEVGNESDGPRVIPPAGRRRALACRDVSACVHRPPMHPLPHPPRAGMYARLPDKDTDTDKHQQSGPPCALSLSHTLRSVLAASTQVVTSTADGVCARLRQFQFLAHCGRAARERGRWWVGIWTGMGQGEERRFWDDGEVEVDADADGVCFLLGDGMLIRPSPDWVSIPLLLAVLGQLTCGVGCNAFTGFVRFWDETGGRGNDGVGSGVWEHRAGAVRSGESIVDVL
ncbi:hypothetical protein B0H14DRAFT_2599774 [Mycena olivaceomarginata]|nr:hypothetical protein B0H14DRAFT_2599774 [Mycena olivaceomarginata]